MTCLMCNAFSFPECSVSLYISINVIFVLKKVAKNCASTCKNAQIELSRVAPLNFAHHLNNRQARFCHVPLAHCADAERDSLHLRRIFLSVTVQQSCEESISLLSQT